MKTVFLLTEISVGGAERVVLDLCTEFKKLGHSVAVIALKSLNYDDIMVQSFQRENVELHSLDIDKKHPFRTFRMKKIIKTLNPDVVSAHLFHPNILSRILLRKRDFKLVNTVHIMEIRPGRQWRFLIDKLTLKMADAHTAVSQSAADFQCEKMHLPANSFKIIRNGIQKPYTPNTEEIALLRRKWGVDDCDIVFGCVGRLNYQKGFDILLNMKNAIAETFSTSRTGLVFIGDGPEMENLKKLAENAPGNMKIVFAGYSANAASECGAFDVFLMPSRFEGFGLTLAEAMAHGLKIAAQNIPPLAEVANGYKNAVLTDFNDTEAAVNAIRQISNASGTTSAYDYSAGDMAEKYLDCFRKF